MSRSVLSSFGTLAVVFCFFAFSKAKSAARNGSEDVGNRYLLNYFSATPDGQCFINGRSGRCVPLGQCPSVEKNARNVTPAQLYHFLSDYLAACSLQGGYCCPDEPMEVSSEAPWAWEEAEDHQYGKPGKPTPHPTDSTYTKPQGFHMRHKNRHLLPEKSCGTGLTSKILGGSEAALGEYPWLAQIGLLWRYTKKRSFICGGSLISKRYVITAAHCFDIPAGTVVDMVRLGEHDTTRTLDCFDDGDCLPPVQDIAIEESIVNKDYSSEEVASYDDIALLRLAEPAEFNIAVGPICIPLDNLKTNYDNLKLESAGWGKTANGRYGKGSTVKLKIAVPVVSHRMCQPIYTKKGLNLRDTQICAGGEEGKDTCQGDSGGPLMSVESVNRQFRMFLVGIVSTGPKLCGTLGQPALYTKVTSYVNWILDHLRD